MDECFLYRNPPFAFPYAGLFNPLPNFTITGPDADTGPSKKTEESKKRREKKRMSQILYSDNRRQRLNERLRAKLENRKTSDEKHETNEESTILSEQDLVTLFDSEDKDKPKKRKRKKRKNRKKKKKEAEKQTKIKSTERTSTQAEAKASEPVTSPEALNGSLESVDSEISVADDLTSEGEKKEEDKVEDPSLEKAGGSTIVRKILETKDVGGLIAEEISETKDQGGSIPGETSETKDDSGSIAVEKCEHLSCGESSRSSTERSTSSTERGSTSEQTEGEEKEAGETVSNDEETEHQEEERSLASLPEERGLLTELILDDEFPWHLYQTDEENSALHTTSLSPTSFRGHDEGFTVVRRKEKRPRKRKPSPPRKKKRNNRRNHRRPKDKKKEKQTKIKKIQSPTKNSPRNACLIRLVSPIITKNEQKPEPPTPKPSKGDPTLNLPQQPTKLISPSPPSPSPPPGFTPNVNNLNSQTAIPSLKQPFEQLQSANALFMKMPRDSIITIPFFPLDTLADGPDLYPMNLDLSYPIIDCTIPYFVFPTSETPIECVPTQYS